MPVLFTQYLRPNGRRQSVLITLQPNVEQMAHELLDHGFIFDIEVLVSDKVSMSCEHSQLESPVFLMICNNGPEVEDTVTALIGYSHSFWKRNLSNVPKVDTGWRMAMQIALAKLN